MFRPLCLFFILVPSFGDPLPYSDKSAGTEQQGVNYNVFQQQTNPFQNSDFDVFKSQTDKQNKESVVDGEKVEDVKGLLKQQPLSQTHSQSFDDGNLPKDIFRTGNDLFQNQDHSTERVNQVQKSIELDQDIDIDAKDESSEESDWQYSQDRVKGDEDEVRHTALDDFDDDTYSVSHNAEEEAKQDEFWNNFESNRQDADTDTERFKDPEDDKDDEYYRGHSLVNSIDDEDMIKKKKPPTGPTNMVLLYTWMILAILIMVAVVSTYQAKCKGGLFNGGRQQTRGEDRKRLLDNEYV